MSFSFPTALLLLLLIPLTIWLSVPMPAFRRRRDILSLIIRSVILLLVILSLSGAQIARTTDRLAVIFLVDSSDSVSPTVRDEAIVRVREAIGAMADNDLAGVILFGQRPQVERPVTDSRTLNPVRSAPEGGNTDIASAVRLALAMFPSDAARRIVVISDGIQTLGDAETAARLAASAEVEISYFPLTSPETPDVRVARFDAPAAVPEGQQFDLSIAIHADINTRARIDITAGGEIIATETVDLRQGTNNRTLTLTAQNAGFRDFQVSVEPEGGDGYYQNNRLATFSQVIGPARVLLVGEQTETAYIAAALREAGLTVDELAARQMPISAAGLVPYESVILANVPADQLSTRQMETLQSYVRDLGGGLVAIGGPGSYGPGGYFDTPLEAMLPLSMRLTDQQRQPRLTIAYVIDRSGSMANLGPDGQPLIELAKAAINRSIDFLQPTDRAGVATFDSAAYWIAELQEVANREELRRLIGTLRPSGGTDIRAGMELVARDIVTQPTEARHIILLSDGLANRGGLIELATELYQQSGVTLTTVAIGERSELMRDMAEAGGGTFRLAIDASTIPTIFAQETVLATRAYIFEDAFTPSLAARSPIMQGITALPALRGYIATTAKDVAQVILRGPAPYEDPILASWQYGLGRAVAFTSDATARWGSSWVSWEDFTRFWNQAVRWTITDGGSDSLETRVVMEETQARIVVDARTEGGDFLNGLELSASVVTPDLQNRRITLNQVAPGRYEATFTPDGEGAYLLAVNGTEAEAAVSQTSGWVMSYSREYLTGNAPSVLPRLAALTEGSRLDEQLTGAFAHTLTARAGVTPIFPFLLLVALLLLPLDIAIRRLLITRADLERLAVALRLRARPMTEPASARMSALIDARERARQAIDAEDKSASAANTAASLRARLKEMPKSAPAAPVTPSETPPAQPPQPSASPPPVATPPAASDESSNIGARLLKRRKDKPADSP